MHSSPRSLELGGDLIVESGTLRVSECLFAENEGDTIWAFMQKHPSLFNDFNVGKREILDRSILDPNSFWFKLEDKGEFIGAARVEAKTLTDASVHIFVFDGKLKEKQVMFRELVAWTFKHFQYNRLSVEVPVIYHNIVNLAEAIGFKREGLRKSVYLMRGRWIHEVMLGILREEVL